MVRCILYYIPSRGEIFSTNISKFKTPRYIITVMIPIYKPYIPESSLKYAYDALSSGWISSRGRYVDAATEKMQELLGVKYVLLLNNGTSACHLMAKSLSKKLNSNKKKKILVPDNVYVAAWNAFLFDKEYKLITIKTDIDTWNIDSNDLNKKITKHPDAAVLIVHNMGNVINVPELQIKYPNTIFVEDACEALLGKYENSYTGTKSFCSSMSFFANKTLTAGESGMIMTNDEDTYLYTKCIHAQGQSKKRFIHNELGMNYRITNVQAALLMGQLEIADKIIEMKNNIFTKYRAAFKDREDVFIQQESINTKHANWMFGLRILDNENFDMANNFFSSRDIEIRPMFYAINEHEYLKHNKNVIIGNCKNAELLNKQAIVLPSFPELKTDEQKHIIDTTNHYIKNVKG
jgi:perosamine synthetase